LIGAGGWVAVESCLLRFCRSES